MQWRVCVQCQNCNTHTFEDITYSYHFVTFHSSVFSSIGAINISSWRTVITLYKYFRCIMNVSAAMALGTTSKNWKRRWKWVGSRLWNILISCYQIWNVLTGSSLVLSLIFIRTFHIIATQHFGNCCPLQMNYSFQNVVWCCVVTAEKVLMLVIKTYVKPLPKIYMTQKFHTLQNGHGIFGRCALDSSPPIKFNRPINFT